MDFSHPAFQPFRPLVDTLPAGRLPAIEELNSAAERVGAACRFIGSSDPLKAHLYEQRIQSHLVIPTRPDNLHDFMNALVWLTYPQFKQALNRAHCQAFKDNPDETRRRSAFRDALTMLDESGILVFCSDPDIGRLLTRRSWHALFIDRRESLPGTAQFRVVGHAVLEKLLTPYLSITGKCLVMDKLPASLDQADQQAAQSLEKLVSTRQLPPLPVAGIPGWHPNNNQAGFYDNTDIFRPLAV
jgi:hypothetical protein